MNEKKLSLFVFRTNSLDGPDCVRVPNFCHVTTSFGFLLIIRRYPLVLPVALCAAEMSTVKGWQNGGIFSWVSETLGERFGFAAIFFQWFQITVGFVTMIYFILGALSYVLNFPALNNDPLMKYIGLLIIFGS